MLLTTKSSYHIIISLSGLNDCYNISSTQTQIPNQCYKNQQNVPKSEGSLIENFINFRGMFCFSLNPPLKFRSYKKQSKKSKSSVSVSRQYNISNKRIMSSLRFFIDAWWTFVLPSICLASMLMNVINVLVLAKLRTLRPVYRRLFAKSIINFMYLFICLWKFLNKCGQFCELFYRKELTDQLFFWIQVYDFYLYGIVGRVLAQCDLFIEILIALQRLRLLTSACSCGFVSCVLGTPVKLIVVISVLIYLPDVFFTRVVWHTGDTFEPCAAMSNNTSNNISCASKTGLRLEHMNKDLYDKVVRAKILLVRVLSILVFFSLINAANCYQIRKKIKRIRGATNLNSSSASSSRGFDNGRLGQDAALSNRMLMWQSMVYIFGNAWFLVLLVLGFLRKISFRDKYIDLYVLCANTPLFVSFGLTFFVYWRYDEKFRIQARSLLARFNKCIICNVTIVRHTTINR